ncbi:MAG: hypothetical protein AVDCRST_MAG40-9 [uncultured Gemmatimonadaceae bacterium]|uniref:Uncharacterized protein n=1 Tax=uncultured Gemmatimonadaceae bacterium TaxID=246130 RepID=A0A6J4K4B9_9BACT|nr:MAG: hypothetical protein AVDCRST_MAG40-9 [uncultured Gemmatimonadaceae bacterium]
MVRAGELPEPEAAVEGDTFHETIGRDEASRFRPKSGWSRRTRSCALADGDPDASAALRQLHLQDVVQQRV